MITFFSIIVVLCPLLFFILWLYSELKDNGKSRDRIFFGILTILTSVFWVQTIVIKPLYGEIGYYKVKLQTIKGAALKGDLKSVRELVNKPN